MAHGMPVETRISIRRRNVLGELYELEQGPGFPGSPHPLIQFPSHTYSYENGTRQLFSSLPLRATVATLIRHSPEPLFLHLFFT